MVLPTLFPLSVLLLEPQGDRLRVAPFVVLGVVMSLATTSASTEKHTAVPSARIRQPRMGRTVTPRNPPTVLTPIPRPLAVGYVVAVIGPAVLSGYPSVVAFGWVNLAGLVVVAVVYADAFASLWCVYAALTSALVMVHMVRRRRLPDADRLEGLPRRAPVA